MRETRPLGPGDEEPLERFLDRHRDSALLLRANLASAGIEDRGEPYQATYAGCFSRGEIVSVAAHCWNGLILLQAERAAEQVARCALEASGRPLAGLLGPWGQVVWVAWTLELPQDSHGLDRPQRLMGLDLDRLIVPEALAGGAVVCRRARSSELELLYNWRAAFQSEVAGYAEEPILDAPARDLIDRQQRDGQHWVLTRNGRLVAGCTISGETDQSVQIGNVSTPKAWRNRGYGRAVVAGALEAARSRGRTRALLFTDNPAAERAYRAIGFTPCGEVGLVRVNRASEGPAPGPETCFSERGGVGSAGVGRGGMDHSADRTDRRQAGGS